MQKYKITYLFPLFLFLGCTTTNYVKTTETFDLKSSVDVYYQAYDHKWKTDPSINPIFNTKEEAHEYATTYNEGNSHSYVVRLINYRYEVRNANPDLNELIYTSNDINDAISFLDDYESEFDFLKLYDLKTGQILN